MLSMGSLLLHARNENYYRYAINGAAYGFADMRPYNSGQAEYLRIPCGDFNCLQLSSDAEEKEPTIRWWPPSFLPSTKPSGCSA
jgi:hypothetical protein